MSNKGLDEDWSAYSEYNKVLRAWFVAFGIGVPATFLVNDDLVKYISQPVGQPHLFVVFLLGAVSQIIMAFINKSINWCAYYKTKTFADRPPMNGWEKCTSFVSKGSDWFLIDVVFDFTTITCFGYAITKLFMLVTAAPPDVELC